MNIRGKSGIINVKGEPGFGSELVDCRDEKFWANIEDGIKSTVAEIIKAGLFTVSSCEGHSESCPYRCVSIISERSIIRTIQIIIAEANRTLPEVVLPIRYYLLDVQNAFTLYKDEFIEPQIIDIVFGDFRDNATFEKQKLFEKMIGHNELHERATVDDQYVLPYLIGKENHIDQYS